MTREQESDSTLPPKKEERDMSTGSPWKFGRGENKLNPPLGGYVPHSMASPKEPMCSFCGIGTHGYKDCPVMHQYIREQADAIAQKRLDEYQQMQAWARYESPRQTLTHQKPQYRGENLISKELYLVENLLTKGLESREIQLRLGSLAHHIHDWWGEWHQGEVEELHPQIEEVLLGTG